MYRVGQILYIILNQKQQVIPAQVIEQVVRKKLDGHEETSHIVRIPLKGQYKEYDLSQLDGVAYESMDEVKKVLFENVSSYIDDITSSAQKLATTSFGDVSPQSPFEPDPGDPSEDNGRVKVTLEDGTIANVKMPSGEAGDVL